MHFTEKQIADAIEAVRRTSDNRPDEPYRRLIDQFGPVMVEWQMREVNRGTPVPDTLDAMAEVAGWIIGTIAAQANANGFSKEGCTALEGAVGSAAVHAMHFVQMPHVAEIDAIRGGQG